jgi:hypothetical protein
MAKRDTLTLLDELEKAGLNDAVFSHELHHLGGTMNGFRAFCQTVGYFRQSGCNQLLHDRLAYMLDRYKGGDRKTMKDHADEAKRVIKCLVYTSCKKHIADQGCLKPKSSE